MKFFSFSRTVFLFAVFAAAQSVALPRELRSFAVAFTVGVYDFPPHLAPPIECETKRDTNLERCF